MNIRLWEDLNEIQTKKTYLKVMEEYLLPFAGNFMPLDWKYQQENDPIHVSQDSTEWFSENETPLIYWPAGSLDLNKIQNVHGWLERKLYANTRQFGSFGELISCVKQC